jgi:hypothetical protein
MRKYLLFFSFLIFSLCSSGQKYLTNAQVYNFNVGDAFETETGLNPSTGPPTYTFDSITAKWYSITADTLYYSEIEYSYTPPSCMSCKGSSSGPTSRGLTITNLDSAAGFVSMGNSCHTKDTVYTDPSNTFCGKRVYKNYPYTDTSNPVCSFEPITTTSWDIEGCGGGYFDYYDPSSLPAGGYYTHLIFFRKHDTICGGENIITGINKLPQQTVSVSIYPNPANTQVTLVYQLHQGQNSTLFKLFNAMGQLVENITINSNAGQLTENVSALSGGIYYYTVSADGIIEATNKLVILR